MVVARMGHVDKVRLLAVCGVVPLVVAIGKDNTAATLFQRVAERGLAKTRLCKRSPQIFGSTRYKVATTKKHAYFFFEAFHSRIDGAETQAAWVTTIPAGDQA